MDTSATLEAEWACCQESLAMRVHTPGRELYTTTTAAAAGADNVLTSDCVQGASDPSFVHTDFLLPEAALSNTGILAQHISKGFVAQLKEDLRAQDQWRGSSATSVPELRHVGGIDISFVPNTNKGVACLAVLSYPALETEHVYMHHCELTQPYISGFLAFREIEPVMALFAEVQDTLHNNGCVPQLLVVDGCGVHHPRRCGLASHLGVLLGIPTIGCAKKMLCVGGVTRQDVEAAVVAWQIAARAAEGVHKPREEEAPLLLPSTQTRTQQQQQHHKTVVQPIIGVDDDKLFYGYAAQTGNSANTCIFVSPGTRMGYAMSVAMVLTMCRHRIPEPIRAADLSSREYIRGLMKAGDLSNN